MSAPRSSLQLYSLRTQLSDLDGTLERVAALGIRRVEPFSIFDRTTELIPAMQRHGLRAPSAHAPFLSDEIQYQGKIVPLPPLAVTLQAADALGIEILVDPMVPAERWRTPDDIARTADRFNAAAAEAASAGIRVGYHNHSFEFHHQVAGLSAYEHFVSLVDPAVALEVDVYWAAVAGQDVAALLRRLGDRVVALHLKDGPLDRDPFASAAGLPAEELAQRPLGEGQLDIRGIMDAAPADRLDVIEFDQVDGDVFEAIAASLAYLERVPDVAS
ncbi:sugar phosphate isomerase/epimerase family protein [Microbacterium ureisolvens]|uniref:Sugar phosphate isomerase/epimerase n=1 Tax=Microbacterium ureisolvens TaxID=2781186 RepID=A0ABS7I0G3_9MICO|nr:sugar phosphate isomerase/epimerase [Microbacterium ureisolvens]MBW9110341.1 sugar phosphate isomerase/epimerase [Microbacterium ureisolvens]